MRRYAIISLAIIALLPGGARAAGSAGANAFNFLFLDADARPVAMGGAYTAIANDANALQYNPAGLGRIRRSEATFMHNEYFQGITQEYIGFASRHGYGANLNILRADDIDRTTISNPDGTGLGHADYSDLAFGLGYGRALTSDWAAGVGVKLIRESIDDVSVTAYAADFGVLYNTPNLEGLTLGLAVQNVGPTVTFHQAKENLPLNVRLGGAYAFELLRHRQLVSLDITKTRAEDALIALGFESRLHEQLALRLGFNTRNDVGPGITIGFGTGLRDFDFDYAFAPFGELGSAHRLSIGMKWGPREEGEAPRAKFKWSRKIEVRASSKTAAGYFSNAEDFIFLRLYDAAKEQLELARSQLAPGDHRHALYYERMARINELQGDCRHAQAQYTEALRLSIPRGLTASYVADAYFGIGRCFKLAKRNKDAIEFLKKALSASPSPETRAAVMAELRSLGALPR